MARLDAYRSRLGALLGEAADRHGVPGAACGVLLDGEAEVAAHGVANLGTGVEITPDTLFQIGSITKLYTATLVMQAHSAGVLALDEPVRAQLQEFSVADPGATLEITPRHLLTHTSGIAGDHLHDTGANQDALMRYVATLAALGQVHAPDEAYSFCNTGFGVLGRLIEVTTGENFDQALRHRLLRPARRAVDPDHAPAPAAAAGGGGPRAGARRRGPAPGPLDAHPLERADGRHRVHGRRPAGLRPHAPRVGRGGRRERGAVAGRGRADDRVARRHARSRGGPGARVEPAGAGATRSSSARTPTRSASGPSCG